MNYAKYRYKIFITSSDLICFIGYGETFDELDRKIEEMAKISKMPFEVKIYESNDLSKRPELTDWKLIETKEVQ